MLITLLTEPTFQCAFLGNSLLGRAWPIIIQNIFHNWSWRQLWIFRKMRYVWSDIVQILFFFRLLWITWSKFLSYFIFSGLNGGVKRNVCGREDWKTRCNFCPEENTEKQFLRTFHVQDSVWDTHLLLMFAIVEICQIQ